MFICYHTHLVQPTEKVFVSLIVYQTLQRFLDLLRLEEVKGVLFLEPFPGSDAVFGTCTNRGTRVCIAGLKCPSLGR